jgi:hypothetical protein
MAVSIRVDGHRIVTAFQKFAKQDPAEIVPIARDTHHSQALAAEEGMDLFPGCHIYIIRPIGVKKELM